jgi:hypothetical protein
VSDGTVTLHELQEASYRRASAGILRSYVERTPWVSAVVSEGERDRHRAVVADGPVTIASVPPDGLLDAWEARFGSRAEWAVAWLELRPERVYSYPSA